MPIRPTRKDTISQHQICMARVSPSSRASIVVIYPFVSARCSPSASRTSAIPFGERSIQGDLTAESCVFSAILFSLLTELCAKLLEPLIHVLRQVVEALVGPGFSHHRHRHLSKCRQKDATRCAQKVKSSARQRGNEPVDGTFERGRRRGGAASSSPKEVGAGDREAELAVAARPVSGGGRGCAAGPRRGRRRRSACRESAGARSRDDVAADDRAAAAAAVGVGEDRLHGAAGVRGAAVFVLVRGEALEGVPAEVGARWPRPTVV